MQESSSQKTATGKNNTSISDCPDPFSRWFCLNGATCFSVNIQNSTIYNCWCPKGFHGPRCDYKYIHTTSGVRYQEEISSNVTTSIETTKIVNETNTLDTNKNYEQIEFIVSVGKQSNSKSDTFGSISRRYTKGIHLIVAEALIVFIAITIVMLITRYVRRKLSGQLVTMEISDAATSNSNSNNWQLQPHHYYKSNMNEQINHDISHERVRLDMMIRREPQPTRNNDDKKQQVQKQTNQVHSFQTFDTQFYRNQHHYCLNHQTMTGRISDNATTGLYQISLMNSDHQQSY